MGRIKAGLSAKQVAKLAKIDGTHALGDPPGLYLCVTGDAASYIFRFSFAGRRPDLGLVAAQQLACGLVVPGPDAVQELLLDQLLAGKPLGEAGQ